MFINIKNKIKRIASKGLRGLFFSNRYLVKSKVGSKNYDLFPASSIAPALEGFYMLELSVMEGAPLCPYQFCSDSGVFNLPVKSTGCVKRICFFYASTASFTLSVQSDGDVSLDPNLIKVKFIKLSETLAIKKIEKKLSVKHGREITYKQLGKEDFYPSYDQLFSYGLPKNDYKDWMIEFEPLLWTAPVSNTDLRFSIVVPTYNSKPEWLDACFNSVLDQSYTNWQLIIVDDASTDLATLNCLKKWQAEKHDRISIVYREKNGHISAATNSGLTRVSGDYVCFLDHDDTLAPQALNELATTISENQDVNIIYSDEDLMSETGERLIPHFKSNWNPELLLAHNYVTHLCCYKTDIIRQLNGMRAGVDGAQDYDLILRASRMVKPEQIIHIPKVLYHWRMVEGSTAMSSGEKSYTSKAGLTALRDHMAEINPAVTVEYAERDNFYNINWPNSNDTFSQPKVSVIIPTRDGLDVLKPCIEGLIHNTSYTNLEIVILDNGSVEKETFSYFAQLSSYDFIKVVRDNGPFNYSAINNHAVKESTGDLICLLNNDIEIINDDWLYEMVSLAIRPEVGCVGAKLLYPDDTIQHAGVILGLGGYAAHSHRGIGRNEPGYFCRAQLRQNLSAVTAACLLVKREIYNEVGGLDEQFEVAYNDVDFCLRVRAAGYQNIYTPNSELYHHESKTRGSDNTKSKQKRFDKEKALLLERWSIIIENDPAYNPNLTRSREDFSLR